MIENLFRTDILYFKLNLNIPSIVDFCYDYKKNNAGRNVSNEGGYQSNDLPLDNSIIQSITERLVPFVTEAQNLYALKPLKISNIWFNVNGYKDFNHAHCHYGSILSAAFYVKVPDTSAPILFHNPSPIDMYLRQEVMTGLNSLNTLAAAYPPEENVLYIFPSWLKHSVQPNQSTEDRISFSFNTAPAL